MALNWLEEITSSLYRLKGYIVIENEDLKMEKTDYRQIRGHSDIDIIAISSTEIIHIECQSWWGGHYKKQEPEVFRRLKDRFELAEKLFQESVKFSFLTSNRKRVFVTEDDVRNRTQNSPWYRLENFCKNNRIELVEIKDIITELIEILQKRYSKKSDIGNEKGASRFLLYLTNNEFLSERFYQK